MSFMRHLRKNSRHGRIILSLLATLLLCPSVSAQAEPTFSEVPQISLPDRVAAEDYANELIARYRSETADSESRAPLQIVHLGDEPPSQLRWLLLRLDAESIPFQLLLMTQREIEETLEAKAREAEQLILVETAGPAEREAAQRIRSLAAQSKLFVKSLLGLPRGLTLWFFDIPRLGLKSSPLLRTAQQKAQEAKNATIQSLLAGASVWTSYYIKNHELLGSGAAGIPVFMAWVWIWAYEARAWRDVMTQGKAIKETVTSRWEVVNSDLSFYFFSYCRGLITNAIVMAALFNGDILSMKSAAAAATNAGINLFARAWIDKWIADRQATTLADGRVEQREGQHSPTMTIQLRFWWEFGYGLLKNLQLVGHSGILDTIYVFMGAVGVSKKVYAERFSILRKARSLRAKTGPVAALPSDCMSLFN